MQGYISIFPFLLGLLEPDSPNLGAILKAIRDPAQMWTDYGLRSLSRDNPLYGTGEDYWRSPIWIPINYLALQSLYTVCLLTLLTHPLSQYSDCHTLLSDTLKSLDHTKDKPRKSTMNFAQTLSGTFTKSLCARDMHGNNTTQLLARASEGTLLLSVKCFSVQFLICVSFSA